MIDSQMDDMIKEKLALKEQVDSLEQNLSKQIKEKECLLQTFMVFKNESKEKENKYMENEIDLEKKIKELDNIIFKVGYQNPFYLKKAQRIKPTLYDGIVISAKHVAMPVIDDEETLILEEESRSKMSEKEKDPEAIKQNISHKPIDYEKLNRLSDDFGKCFTPQQEYCGLTSFLVSLVNESLKKLKFHLARFDNVVKIRTTPDARTEEFFENNDLKAQLQDKDSIICKLKDIIKSKREKLKKKNVKYDYGEIETKNVELENSVAKLILENERLCNEIIRETSFKEQFDTVKKKRVRTKEQSDSLIDKLNIKSAENEDLKAQIQDKVFVITSLKNNLQKVKGKVIVDIATQIPSANTIVPGMFKLDLEPLAPMLLQNREAHIDYLKYTQEKADIL
ncbi:hypothetical protein Tco_0682008 [Tanacetum coccineum]|uniref:Uncharacterized protein n=1 Tax=Tanacetum coccineum TaxID=301880 RepID=A0ABQ4XPY8_9ASTR